MGLGLGLGFSGDPCSSSGGVVSSSGLTSAAAAPFVGERALGCSAAGSAPSPAGKGEGRLDESLAAACLVAEMSAAWLG